MTNQKIMRILHLGGVALAVVAVSLLVNAVSAPADMPWWHLSSETWPAVLPSSGEGTVETFAENLGDAQGTDEPLVVVNRLSAGVIPQSTELVLSEYNRSTPFPRGYCEIAGQEAICRVPESALEYIKSFYPYDSLDLRVQVKTQEAIPGATSETSVSGIGAVPVSLKRQLMIGDRSTPFGVKNYELMPENDNGSLDRQAGSHPFQLTTTFTLNQDADPTKPPALAKDLHFNLPVGLIGNPTVTPQCSLLQFTTPVGQYPLVTNTCGEQTAIGVADISFDEPDHVKGVLTFPAPIFNLTPAVGEPARFGFMVASVPVILDTAVRTGGDYGVIVSVKNISEVPNFMASRVTFWGDPGDPRHDNARGWNCVVGEAYSSHTEFTLSPPCTPGGDAKAPPFLTMPTSCTGELQSSVEADSWEEKGVFTAPFAATGEPSMEGCNKLPFSSSISVVPDGTAGSEPTGLTVGVHVPQEEALNPTGLSPADVKNTTVALPAGIALNPAAADGLQACTETQIGLSNTLEATCPEAAKVATLEIHSPLLPNPLVGEAYLAEQNANPFGSLVALYLVARDPVSGVLVKLAGEVKPDPITGQLLSTFLNTPQLPFEDLKLHFFGGSRAPLATPAFCGDYTTEAEIQPWSGNYAAHSSSAFQITSGPENAPCASPLPFAPQLTAGSLNLQAGGLTPFTTTMSRTDGQQNLRGIQLHMPPGLSGLLSGVKLCGEPEGNSGTCGPDSQIGETIVSVGVGGTPFSVRGGRVYITGPYHGAPFGLSIVNPAKAGPYDLEKNTPCDCVVVRAKIEVDPVTAALTVTTDDTGPYKIPTILDGIPLQIQHINVTINRPGFTFNPTNCDPMSITGRLSSVEGATSALSVPLQVTNCAILAFKPGFKVSTSGKTSRQNGASLHVKLTYPKAPFGSQANIHSVKVDLPKQLPSELKTLQHACPHETFEINPAACPSASRVGYAKATTPLLPVPLEGPAYFVSYGGKQFPELIVVLQGYGVTLDLHGETFINERTSITSSTFRTVPDAPVGTFELNLPEGPFSALGANGNLCSLTKTILVKKMLIKSKGHNRTVTRKVKSAGPATLTMPTIFTAQNGAVIKQSTPISVTGCAKAKKTAPKTNTSKHRSGVRHKT